MTATRQQQVERMLGIETYLDVAASWATFDTDEYYLFTRGIRTWKLRDDLARYAKAIEQSRPDLIVEVGTKWGGSALWLSGFDIPVITVDIDQRLTGAARNIDLDRALPRVQFVEGDSIHPDTLAKVAELAQGYERVMVSLDGEHAAPHVYHEILSYGPMVGKGCYLVVEDGIFDLVDPAVAHRGGARIPAEGGPLAAIRRAELHTDPRWMRDVEIEKMSPKTYHVGGFWRRLAAA